MKKLLFLSHELTRTGAPLALLFFIKWLRSNRPDYRIVIISLKGGNLEPEFKKVCDEFHDISAYQGKKIGFKKYILNKIYDRIGLTNRKNRVEETFFRSLALQNFDLIYANTVLTIPLGDQIKQINKRSKLVVHVHELETIIKMTLPALSTFTSQIDGFIAVSNLVKENLNQNHSIPKNKIETVFEYSENLKTRSLGKEQNKFIVGGAGTAHWRKGQDIFIQTAIYLKTYFPEIDLNFIWVGAVNAKERLIIEGDIEKAGLEDVISFIGEKEDPLEYFSQFDVFILTSREDPFPLVCIEVGALGKPVICFKNATGTAEVLESGGGKIIPYLDIRAMAEAIVYYYNHPQELKKDGQINKEKFSQFSPEIICPQIFSYLKKVVDND